MPRRSVGAAGAKGSNDNQTWLRKNAIEALALAKDDFKRRGVEPKPKALARVAARIFNGKCPEHTIGRPARFIALWAKRWEATTSLADAKRRGRRSKLTAEAAARAVQLLEAGFKDEEGLQRPFFDIHHALLECEELERIRRKAHLEAESLWRRLRAIHPDLKQRVVAVKPSLSTEQMAARAEAASLLLAKGDALQAYLRRCIWIDSKKVLVTGKKCRVICTSKSRPGHMVHAKCSFRKQDRCWINYYIAVNYFSGTLVYQEVTGTTGLKQGRYKVGQMS
jgi:hypothetical protein